MIDELQTALGEITGVCEALLHDGDLSDKQRERIEMIAYHARLERFAEPLGWLRAFESHGDHPPLDQIVHKLRTPLTVIETAVYLLQTLNDRGLAPLNNGQQANLLYIQTQVKQIESRVRQLRD